MLDVGGQDSTEAFEDVGHSDEAREILDGLLVGTLKRQVSISPPYTHTYILTHLAILAPRTQCLRKQPSDPPPCHPPVPPHKTPHPQSRTPSPLPNTLHT